MTIVFFCQSCGARFEVAPKFAGKKGHCKKCGQQMTIPQAEHLASMAAMPALAASAVGPGAVSRAGVADQSMGAWLRGGLSNVGLAPITVDRMLVGKKKPTMFAEDDLADSKPYVLAKPERENRGRVHVQDHVVVRTWRRHLGNIQKLFRKINQAAYLVSVPFLMILLAGIAVRNRPTALFGATFVVLLNIGRLVAGGANLAVVPLRDGINVKKMDKPLKRVIEPAVTISLVVIAFTFIPWLSGGQTSKGSVADRIRSSAASLGTEMKGETARAVDQVKDLDLSKLGAPAQEKLKGIGSQSADQPGGATKSP